jgi:NAD(P)H-flavin reductase/ferredoxin
MSQLLSVKVENMPEFRARHGETLLDAALRNGVDMPHDCRSGHCGTCRCNVVSGSVAGGEIARDSILACQAQVVSDLEIALEEVPPIESFRGRLISLVRLSENIVEATIEPSRPLAQLPGQYFQFRFNGFPGRCYSPTAPLEGAFDRGLLRLHIRQLRDGRVSGALGEAIRPGHKVKIEGPYGSAYLRPGLSNRLVLVASGTGFAPIWSIAHAALCEMPDRELVVIAGARTRDSLYMGKALLRLMAFPNAQVVPVVEHARSRADLIKSGTPLDHLPALGPDDIVYAAGAPAMVEAVGAAARAAGARWYADPFSPAASEWLFSDWASQTFASASKALARPFNRTAKPAHA